jgi:hypothetical protein
MLGFWQVRRGRKAAVLALGPFVERSRRRLAGIPESVWLDPYMIGFMCTAVTVAATREADGIGTEALGLIQSQAWGQLTGLNSDLLGEEVSFLSTSRSDEFLNGCRNALLFSEALHGPLAGTPVQDMRSAALTETDDTAAGSSCDEGMRIDAAAVAPAAEYGGSAEELWALYFDAAIAGTSPYAVHARDV